MLLFASGICIGAGVVSIAWALFTGLLCLQFDTERRREALVNRGGACVRTERMRGGHAAPGDGQA